MVYQQKIQFCFEDEIGSKGISKAEFENKQKIFAEYIAELQVESLNLLDFSNINETLENTQKIVDRIKDKAKTLYVLGTGGASLTGQTICGLFERSEKSRKIVFVDNVDPVSMDFILNDFKPKTSHILIISKSGGTIETVALTSFFLKAYLEEYSKDVIKSHFTAITETGKENTIKDIADYFKIPCFQHEYVGGRFSIFSSIGLVPALFVGLDVNQFIKGAKDVLDNFYTHKAISAPAEGAILNACFTDKNISSTILMPYIERLKNFTVWYCQIWAESLGKTEKAITPVRSLGTIDQHSQLQLYLEGKKDKLFNILINNKPNREFDNLDFVLELEEIKFLKDKTMADIMNAAAYSTIETLKLNGLPTRYFEIDGLDEESLGAISMHFILETILMAKYLGINAFDQPAVEQGKKIAIKMLKENRI